MYRDVSSLGKTIICDIGGDESVPIMFVFHFGDTISIQLLPMNAAFCFILNYKTGYKYFSSLA